MTASAHEEGGSAATERRPESLEPLLPKRWSPSGPGGLACDGFHALDCFAALLGDRIIVGDRLGVVAQFATEAPDHWDQGYAEWVLHLLDEGAVPNVCPDEQRSTFKQLLEELWSMDPGNRFPAYIGDEDDDLPEDIAALLTHMRTYLHMPDADDTLAVLGAGVAHVIEAYDPLWLMLVDVSSSGKGERLRQLDDVADAVMSDVTLAGLLTNRGSCGILKQFEAGNALILMRDFSTLLDDAKMSGSDKTSVFNALREIYDGEFHRDMSPQPVHWHGRVSFVAACTPAIDQFSAHHDALGTRWLYFRKATRSMEERRHIARVVTDRTGLAVSRGQTRALASAAVAAARMRVGSVVLPQSFDDVLIDVATLVGYGRASVPREWGNRGEIDDIVTAEEPGRMLSQLRMLALGLLALGLPDARVLRIVQRCATSSMPQARARALEVIARSPEPLTAYKVKALGSLEHRPAKRALEDWAAVGVLDTVGVQGGNGVETEGFVVSSEFAGLVAAVYGQPLSMEESVIALGATTEKKREGE